MEILSIERAINAAQKELQARQAAFRVTAEDIASLVARVTRIPVGRMQTNDFEKLATIEGELEKRVVGQKKAIESIANALRRNRIGLRERHAPVGSFLFLGPTGVGKTELAKALAEYVLDDESKLIRVDMSEYMERHEAAKLIGSPPGYVGYGEGGQLTEKMRRHPYSVVLFDEVEKAHPDIFNMLLQVLDDGRMTDAEGRVITFEHSIIIFTSNLGSEFLSGKSLPIGLVQDEDAVHSAIEGMVRGELKKHFRPEFLNRLDDIIIFNTLSKEECLSVLNHHLQDLRMRVEKMGFDIQIAEGAVEFLLEKGFDPVNGARPLRRIIEREIENKVASEMIKVGRLSESPLNRARVLRIVCSEGGWRGLEVTLVDGEGKSTFPTGTPVPTQGYQDSLLALN